MCGGFDGDRTALALLKMAVQDLQARSMREGAASKAERLLVSGRVFLRRMNANEVVAA